MKETPNFFVGWGLPHQKPYSQGAVGQAPPYNKSRRFVNHVKVLLSMEMTWLRKKTGNGLRQSILGLVGFSLWFASCAWPSALTQETLQCKPNIVFILVDDLGWSDLGCYNAKTTYETPQVDLLAAQGMRFTDFYAAGPVCSPTRASILTGKYPVRTGITTYLLSPSRDPQHVSHHLKLEEQTIAEAFKKHGYATGYFGKWHLGYRREHWAAQQGFDSAKGGMDLPWAWKLAHPDKPVPALDRSKGHQRFFSPHHLTFMEDGPEGEYLTDRLTNEAIHFIERNQDKPFFALLSFHTVHTPLQAKEEVILKYQAKMKTLGLEQKNEENPRFKQYQNNPNYAAMVQHMDENVGRLLTRIRELGLEQNTIVVFSSDNGGKGSVTSNRPLKGAKHDLNEGGIRVPLVVKWPQHIKAGTQCDFPLITNDLYPSLLDLADCPLKPEQHQDGISFKDILLGQKTVLDRETLFWHYPHGRYEGAVRRGDFKLIHFFKKDRAELYNLREDIGETRDLSAGHPEMTQDLLNLLKRWQRNIDARL